MKPIRFDIKEPKLITKRLTILGWTILLAGITLSFAVDMETDGRLVIIGVPLISGLLILLTVKLIYPLKSQGSFEISNTQISISKDKDETIIDLHKVSEIELRLGGGQMTLNKSWWPLSKEFFPFEHGHNNEIIFKQTDGQKINSRLFLTGKRHERELKNILSELTDNQNIVLKIKNN